MGRSQNLCTLDGAAKRRCVNRDNLLVTQTFRQASCLLAAFIGERDIGRAGKPVLSTHDRDAVSNHENARGCRFHTIRHDVNSAKRQSLLP